MCVHISRHCVFIQITSPGYFLQAFLPLFILCIPGLCIAARRNAFYCQSKHVCSVDMWSLLPPWQACHGRMKKIDRKGRGENYFLQHWEYFPLLYKELLCGERGQDEKWAVKGFFHGNLRLCMHFFSYAFHTEKRCMFFYCTRILCDKVAENKSDQ